MSWIDRTLLEHIWVAAGGAAELTGTVELTGDRVLSSRYPVNDLAAASIGVAGLALAEFAGTPGVLVDRARAGGWFGMTLRPDGWTPPPVWDSVAGDYRCSDGWIRLHTNDPAHRRVALAVLGVAEPADRELVGRAVGPWTGEHLETAIIDAGGCAAELRSPEQWRNHHQGMAVAHEPLIGRAFTDVGPMPAEVGRPGRPLAGLKVLDLTRVLAGPAATRFLAGFGAQVLRIDPPDRLEPGVEMEMNVGKHCARLDLRRDRSVLIDLLAQADVLIHGYRPGAMAGLGLGEPVLHATRPGLVEVMLDAYGWSGPWRGRRGFDSLVQMSSGIADPIDPAGPPSPLPVQALDHAAGYLAATALLRGLSERRRTGLGSISRVSLARTATFLQDFKSDRDEEPIADLDRAADEPEWTHWGPGLRLPGPVTVGGASLSFEVKAAPFGSASARWL